MTTKSYTTELEQFRQQLYQNFNNRADVLLELVDALCSFPEARSAVELSLAPCFRRGHASLYAAIADHQWSDEDLSHLAAPYVPRPRERPFWLMGTDVTPLPRPFAATLDNRGMVYQPNMVKGNKPVAVGHQYSTTALLPEAENGISPSWLVPLTTERVKSSADKEMVGSQHMDRLLRDPALPWHQELVVEVVDSSYSKRPYLCANRQHANLVTLCRVASNRTFYRSVPAPAGGNPVGHPTWYGDPFRLSDPATWPTPDETAVTPHRSRRGKAYQVEIEAWRDMLMTGKRQPVILPMHTHPFTLLRIVLIDPETNLPAFKRPLWLMTMGERRAEVSLLAARTAYAQRYDLEHFFRFGKQNLLLNEFQTPKGEHEEAWWHLVHIAYLQLWVGRHLANSLPRPWERNLPEMKTVVISPTLAQRDWGRIIRQLGTPAQPPKPRGNSTGWPRGRQRQRRERRPVVVKGQLKANSP
jgi:hypothetical protein